jgi:uncharacterized membrane protein
MASSMQVPRWLEDRLASLEANTRLDPIASRGANLAGRISGRAGEALRGNWLGHAVHPLLTDFPLGCWIGAGLLDLFGGSASRKAAQRLVGLGLLAVPPTVATGVADYATVTSERSRRVGVAHAAGNGIVTGLYLLSWRARRQGRHAPGVSWALAGGALAWITGYLGGHLSFARQEGTGERGMYLPAAAGDGAAWTSARVMTS